MLRALIYCACGLPHLRNTFRFLLGNLDDTQEAPITPNTMPFLERWMLAQLSQTHARILKAFSTYQLGEAVSIIHHFCNTDLSSFYFDIRKDSLYCDDILDPQRQATTAVLWQLLRFLNAWIAPLLPFTAEDVFQTLKKERPQRARDLPTSVHLMDMPTPDKGWKNDSLLEEMVQLRTLRSYVTAGIEKIRERRHAGTSLELYPHLYITDRNLYDLCVRITPEGLATFMITSHLSLSNSEPQNQSNLHALYTAHPSNRVWLDILKANGDKCARCWRWMTLNIEQVCARCEKVIDNDQNASASP